ncbi:MAG: hypothetical protein QNK03_01150 [Myxococcota bacterium]|nr:hypothetical protein [Myxococcota bacterium]
MSPSSPAARLLRSVAFPAALALTLVAPAHAADRDEDGVEDSVDNCLEVANPDQRDVDRDGKGSLCDPDFNQDGLVGIPDFNRLRAQFGLRDGDPGFDPNVDMNGDGGVGVPDFNILRRYFGSPPGPAGAVATETLRTIEPEPDDSLLEAVKRFEESDPEASFSFFNGAVDSFATAPKPTVPEYALPILEALGLPTRPAIQNRLPRPVHSDDSPKPARDLDGDFTTLLPILPETQFDQPLPSEGRDDDNDKPIGDLPGEEKRTEPPRDPQQLFPWEPPSDELVRRERQAALPILRAFLDLHKDVFQVDPGALGGPQGQGLLAPTGYRVDAFLRSASYQQWYVPGVALLDGRTLVQFDANWNVVTVSRMLTTREKLPIPLDDAIGSERAVAIASKSAPFRECLGRPFRVLRSQPSADPIRQRLVWDVDLVSEDGDCHWRTLVAAADGAVLNVSDEIDRAFTDAKVNRWYFPGGDQFGPQQIVSNNIYTRNDRRLEHDFFYVMNDHRCEGDPESSCSATSHSSVWCDEAHGTTNGDSYIRATRRTARDFDQYYPSGASETFAETNAYYWARSFSQWLKSSLDALGVLPSSASNFPRVLIITDACRSGSVHNSSYDVTTDDNKGEGTNVIRLAHRNPGGSSNHNAGCQGGGCFDNPSNIAHELNHFYLKRYYGVGSGLDCGSSNQLKFTHEGILGTAVPQAYWHYYYGVGYAPDTDKLYFSHSSIGQIHHNKSTRMTIGDWLCVNNTDDPYSAGRVVGQALWKFYHGREVVGSSSVGAWRPSTDRDFNVLVYWAADLQAASTWKDRYEYANRLMEILDKHSNWSSAGKAQYCDIFDAHEVDNFIAAGYCN